LQDLNAKVSDAAQGQAGKLRDSFAHLPENVVQRINAIAAAERLQEIAQNLPIIAPRD
jgi:hypothetical protein